MPIGRPFEWSHFELHLCTSEEQYRRLLRKWKFPKDKTDQFVLEGADACTHELSTDGHGDRVIVCIRPHDSTDDPLQYVGLLIHEAVHVWQSIRDNIGEDKPSSEFEAYSIQSIAEKLLKEYRKQVLTPRKRRLTKNEHETLQQIEKLAGVAGAPEQK